MFTWPPLRKSLFAILLLRCAGIEPGGALSAGDWPQILGPERNGVASADEVLLNRWEAAGPQVLWERSVGSGFAGVVVQGDLGILFHRERTEEVIEAFSVKTGEPLWKSSYPTSFYPQVGGGDGPLCTPTISEDRVISYGAQGVLTATELTTGKRLWQVKTHEEFRAQEGYFGAGSSPIVVNDVVVVNVGGSRQQAGVVGFSLKDGKVLWQQTNEPASYSAPTSCLISGIPHVLMVTRYKCLMLDAEHGTLRFEFPFGQRGPTVNGATPVVHNNHLFVTSSYGLGSVYAEFGLSGFLKVWEGERPIASQYCTPILIGEHLYVIDGRDDLPPADFKCVELATGKVVWTTPDFGYGTLIRVGQKLLITKTNGELLMAEVSPEGMKVLSKARPLRGTVRALPALSNGRFFLRDQNRLICLAVAPGF